MLNEFKQYLLGIGKSENTALNYCDKVKLYLKWCLDSFGSEPQQLYRANVLDYISYMKTLKRYNPKSVNNHLSSLRSFNEFLIASGRQSELAILKNDFMKVQVQYANPCTVEQKDVEAFRQRLLEGGSKRDFAIVTLYTYTGIRRSECVNLRVDQVDLIAKEIYVVGKGEKHRTVYLNDKTVHAIREYLKVRNSDSPYLFVSRQSELAILKNDFMKVQVQYANPCTVEQKDVEAFRQRLLEGGNKRDFAIVTLYTYTGIRRSECVNLRVDQVDLIAKEIYVVGKGNKHRTVYLNDKTVHAIREYLKVRNSDSPYLFVSRQSEKMAASRINQIFNQYSDIITPKMLRHYFCSHALDTGDYKIHEVANQAGHSNVQTTLIYSNPSARQMKEKANKL